MAITAEQVRDLRELTGAGMMDCKRALEEANGDTEKSIAILREKGLASAAKKAGRIASEGLVAAYITPDHQRGALVEINCETDFVAKNEDFIALVSAIAQKAAECDALPQTSNGSGADLAQLPLGNGKTAGEALTELVAKIGENMSGRRYARFAPSGGQVLIESYIHLGGKIGILVELECENAMGPEAELIALARDLAMQVAAAKPEYVKREEVPAETLANERAIYKAQAMNEGKTEQVAAKIVVGRVEKYYKDICLLEQPFIKNQDQSCKQLIGSIASQYGVGITLKRFARFERGEGMAKRENDFAAEVRAQLER